MTASTIRLAFALGEQMVVSGASFIIGILVVRFLGIESYGLFAVLWIVVQFAQGLISSTIIAPFVNEFHASTERRRPAKLSANYARACALSLLFAVLIGMTGSVASRLAPEKWSVEWTLCLVLWCCTTCLADAGRRHLYAVGRVGASATTACTAYGTQPLAVWWFMPRDVSDAMVILAGCSAMGAAIGLTMLAPSAPSRAAIWENLRATTRSACWLGGASVLQWIAANIVTLLVTGMLGLGFAGALRAAQNLVGPVGIFFQAMDNFLMSEAARRFQNQGHSAMSRYLARIGMLQLIAGGILLAGIAWQAPLLVALVYGRADPEIARGLRGFTLFYWVGCLANPVVAWARTMRREQLMVIGQVANIVVTAALVVLWTRTIEQIVLSMVCGQIIFLTPQYLGWIKQRSRS